VATVDPTLVAAPTPPSLGAGDETEVQGRSPWQLFWLRFKKDKAAIGGGVFIIFLIVLALTAPLISKHIAHHSPNDVSHHTERTTEFGLPLGPDKEWWFGSDTVGRDVFVRTIYGTRTSLIVALFATGIALFVGVSLGMLAGFLGGWTDTIVSRVVDVILSMPLLIFAIGIAAACQATQAGCLGGLLKPGLSLVIFIIALFSWTYPARLIRGQSLSLREREFVEASRSLGAGNFRIMFKEILPNLLAPLIVYGTLLIPANILFEAYLSFLGLGVPDSIPSWGGMISNAAGIFEVAWWLMIFPGLFLLATTLAFNLLGDGLRDALDPRTSRV
jgi:peptide/nickel transport system permease protein